MCEQTKWVYRYVVIVCVQERAGECSARALPIFKIYIHLFESSLRLLLRIRTRDRQCLSVHKQHRTFTIPIKHALMRKARRASISRHACYHIFLRDWSRHFKVVHSRTLICSPPLFCPDPWRLLPLPLRSRRLLRQTPVESTSEEYQDRRRLFPSL